jgi:uncharacterized protein YsxB (DUF464 family)
MISVTIYKDSFEHYRGFMLEGHAGAGVYGSDIVCAAVSALVLNAVNSIEAFTVDDFSVDSADDGGYIKLMFEQTTLSTEAGVLMDSLVLGLEGIRDSGNKKYIRISFKEV